MKPSLNCFFKCVVYIALVVFMLRNMLMYADMITILIDGNKNFSQKLDEHVIYFDPNIRNFGSVIDHPLTRGESSPYFLETQERYNGEDASFECRRLIVGIYTSKPHINQVLWKKNGRYVKPDARYNISWVFEEYKNSSFYKLFDVKELLRVFIVTSKLEIRLIEEQDYGVYNCYVSQRTDFVIPDSYRTSKPRFENENSDDESRCQCHNTLSSVTRDLSMDDIEQMFFDWNQFAWQSEFRLVQDHARTEKIFAAPGTIIILESYFRHLGSDEDISMHYTINNKKTEVFQSKCSMFVLLYYSLFNRNIINTIFLMMSLSKINYTSRSEWKAALAVVDQCISPKSYGIHDIVITRTIIDATRDLNYTKEFSHPLKLDIRPKTSDLFHLNKTYPSPSMFDVNCWSSERDPDDPFCLALNAFLEEISDSVYFADSILLVCIIVVICILTIFLIFIIYYANSFVTPMFYSKAQVAAPESLAGIQEDESESLANIPVQREEEIKYHIFVSYVDADYIFLRNTVLPILKSIGLKTFVRNDDITPGSYILTEIGKAIMKSHSFIVIASPNYMKDSMRNKFEINGILDTADRSHILILRKNGCRISKLFKRYNIIDWNWNQISAAKLENWIYQTFPRWSPRSMSFIYVFIGVLFVIYAFCYLLFLSS